MSEQTGKTICPNCRFDLTDFTTGEGETIVCHGCLWRGRIWTFNPLPARVDRPDHALPEDAVCAHHPTKRAETICAGTGDYICSLCAVTVNGQTYSAAYLNRPEAKQQLAGAWEQNLARPDRRIVWLIALCIFPCYQALLGPVFIIWAGFEYVRLLKMRRDHPLYARLVGPAAAVIAPIVLLLVAGLWLLGAGSAAYGIYLDVSGGM